MIARNNIGARRHDHGDQLRGLVILVLGFAALSLVLDPDRYLYEFGAYLAAACRALVYLGLPIVLVMSLAADPRHPLSWAVRNSRTKGLSLLIAMLLMACGLAAFTTFKQDIPARIPFYTDDMLDGLDRLIHGTAPYRYTHALISGQFELALYWVYTKVWYILWFGIFVLAALSRPSVARTQYLWTHALVVVIIGTVLALGLSSYGPIFYGIFSDRPAYGDLLAHFQDTPAGAQLNALRDYLVASYQSGSPKFGAGISAMPSMHVALATLNVLYLLRLSKRLLVPGVAFLLAIIVGSVHFGWHYAVDGYVSLILVGLIWKAAGRVLGSSGPRAFAGLPEITDPRPNHEISALPESVNPGA